MSMSVACPWCGGIESSEWLLSLNHWVRDVKPGEYDWCATNGMCIAMNLTRNHIIAYSMQLAATQRRPSDWNADRCRDHLALAIARAEDVWPRDRQEWLYEYRHLVQPVPIPEHGTLIDSEAVALW